MRTSVEIRAERAKLVVDARKIVDKADAEKRGLDAAERETWDKIMADVDRLLDEAQVTERQERAEADLEETRGRQTDGNRTAQETRDQGPAVASTEYAAAFSRFISRGNFNGAPASELASIQRVCDSPEYRNLQANIDTQGQFLIAPQLFVEQLIRFVNNLVFIRKDATVMTVTNAVSLGVPSLDTDPDDADWTSELLTGNEDSAMAFGKRELAPKPLAKRIRLSNKLLRMSNLAEPLVRERLAYKFGIAQEKAFLTGTGANQPLGLFTASSAGISTGRDFAAAATTALTADDLIGCKYNLKQQYMQSKTTRWLFNRSVLAYIRKLKDENNQYLWQPSGLGTNITTDGIDQLLEVPVYMSEYVPATMTAGLYVGLIGDLKHYWIADALGMIVQRLNELYAETNQTGFILRAETDGMPVLEEAFSRLTMHA